MAKQAEHGSLLAEMGSVALYKRTQGRLVRQLTAVGLGLIAFFGVYSLSTGPLSDTSYSVRVGVPWGIAIACAWFIFRLMHWAPFADFLISVEAEIDKITWASKEEIKRSTIVVLVTMVFLGVALLLFDLFWQWFFRLVGFLNFG